MIGRKRKQHPGQTVHADASTVPGTVTAESAGNIIGAVGTGRPVSRKAKTEISDYE